MIFVLTLASFVALSWGLPTDFVIQFERTVLVNCTVVERVLVGGASEYYLKGQFHKQPVVSAIKDEALRMIAEHDCAMADNGTYIRLRECKVRGYQVVRLSDRVQINGRDYLALDVDADSWTALVPEATELRKTWAHETGFANLEKTHLKDNCKQIIKQMNDDHHKELGVLRVIAPVLTTFLFIGFVFTSFLIFKQQGQHPGGVIGSIIHYPAHHLEVPFAGQSPKISSNTETEPKQQIPPVLNGLFQQS